jgi:sarcosine oxidase, subunit alpha
MGDLPTGPARWRGRPVEVRRGETFLAALARREFPLLGRSIRYHRPRAPFCGIGACSQCLVRVNGQPNVRACQYFPAAGDVITSENAWPSPRFDVLGALDYLFRGGIDTLHGFRSPRWATPLYHAVVRRLAGYGRLAERPAPPPPRGESLETGVVILGGGLSGRSVAQALVEGGSRPLVVDRSRRGSPPPGCDYRPGTTVAFLPPPTSGRSSPFEFVAVGDNGAGLLVRARTVVVAVGGYDAGLLFDGNDRPGVLSAEGAEAISSADAAPPFRAAAIFGGGSRARSLLDRFGRRVGCVIAPGAISAEVTAAAAQAGIPLYPRMLLVAARGRSRLRRLELRPRGGGATFHLAADALLLAHRRLPNPQLFFQAGAQMTWSDASAAYYPLLHDGVRTSVDGLLAVGEAAGFTDPDLARASGAVAAAVALGHTPPGLDPPRSSDPRPSEMVGYLRELLPVLAHRQRAIVCPCEDILLGELLEANHAGYRGMEVVKRYTGVGTGLCQGRYCLPDGLLVLSILETRSPGEVGYITQRPPVFPTPLSALAGLPDPIAEATP